MADTSLDFLLYLALIGAPFACMIATICGLSELQESLELPEVGVGSVIGWCPFILACIGFAVTCLVILWNSWK